MWYYIDSGRAPQTETNRPKQQEEKHMKIKNVKYTCATQNDETAEVYSVRMFCTADAVSRYANEMFRKYGDKITVTVFHAFTNDVYCTYHA